MDLSEARLELTGKVSAAEARENYEYDERRFVRYSDAVNLQDDRVNIRAYLLQVVHAIEKGLTIAEPRPGFAQPKLLGIIEAGEELVRRADTNSANDDTKDDLQTVDAARHVVGEYVQLHKKHYYEERKKEVGDDDKWWEPHLKADVAKAAEAFANNSTTKHSTHLTLKEVQAATDFEAYTRFIHARHSIRQFDGAPVDPAQIRAAVALALRTPRVCNRESRRVYPVHDDALRTELLSYHHGHAGFDDKLPCVLVITVDVRHFNTIGERNQVFIDGGLFAQSLCFALHAQALGTVFLNWGEDYKQDQCLRSAFKIPDYEAVITFFGVGHMVPELDVCKSDHIDVDSVIKTLERTGTESDAGKGRTRKL